MLTEIQLSMSEVNTVSCVSLERSIFNMKTNS